MEEVWLKVLASVLAFIFTGLIGWLIKILTGIRKELRNRDDEKFFVAVDSHIDSRIEPLRKDLEDLKDALAAQAHKEEELETELVASYKFRLTHLCKMYIAQKCITQDQYDQLTEMYKLYAYLGGNGQAKKYYDRAIALDIVEEVPNPQDAYRADNR